MKNQRGYSAPKEPLKLVSPKPAPHQIVYKQQTKLGEKFIVYVPLRVSSSFLIFMGTLFKFFTFLAFLGFFSLGTLYLFAPPLWHYQISSWIQKFSTTTQKNALQKGLSSPDKNIREETLQILAEMGPLAKEILPNIEPLLKDEEESVRNLAAQVLGKIAPEENSLIPQSHSSSPPQKDSSSKTSTSIKPKNTTTSEDQSLIKPPSNSEPTLPQKDSSDSEKTSQKSTEIPRSSDEKNETRIASVFLEKKTSKSPQNETDSIPRLIEKLKDSDANIRSNAKFVLSNKGSIAIPELEKALLQPEEYELRREIGLVLGKMETLGVSTLIKALQNENWSHRYIAADALCDIGPEAITALPYLIQTTQDPNKNVQESSIKAIGEMGPAAQEAVPALLTLLSDNATNFRILAAEALFKIGSHSEKATQTLQEIQKNHDNTEVRKLAGEVLQKFSNQ